MNLTAAQLEEYRKLATCETVVDFIDRRATEITNEDRDISILILSPIELNQIIEEAVERRHSPKIIDAYIQRKRSRALRSLKYPNSDQVRYIY
jgi:hypothetical protein